MIVQSRVEQPEHWTAAFASDDAVSCRSANGQFRTLKQPAYLGRSVSRCPLCGSRAVRMRRAPSMIVAARSRPHGRFAQQQSWKPNASAERSGQGSRQRPRSGSTLTASTAMAGGASKNAAVRFIFLKNSICATISFMASTARRPARSSFPPPALTRPPEASNVKPIPINQLILLNPPSSFRLTILDKT